MGDEKSKRDWKDQFENLSVSEIIQQLNVLPIEAAYALGSRGAVEAVKPLINKFVYPPDDTVWNNLNNLAIAWALGQIGDKSAIPALVEALKTDEHNLKWKEDSTICELPDINNPEIKTILPYIVSTCTLSKKGSSIEQVLKEFGYFS